MKIVEYIVLHLTKSAYYGDTMLMRYANWSQWDSRPCILSCKIWN